MAREREIIRRSGVSGCLGLVRLDPGAQSSSSASCGAEAWSVQRAKMEEAKMEESLDDTDDGDEER